MKRVKAGTRRSGEGWEAILRDYDTHQVMGACGHSHRCQTQSDRMRGADDCSLDALLALRKCGIEVNLTNRMAFL